MNILKSLISLKKFPLYVSTVIFIVSAYFAVVFNHPIIQKVYELSHYDLPLYFASHLLMLSAFIIIFSLLAWPYLFKIIVIPLILLSALAFYASVTYNIMFDYDMMENIFETNTGEALSYVNLSSILAFLVLGVLPAFLLFKVKITYGKSLLKTFFVRALLLFGAIAMIALIAALYYKDYASIGRNNSYLNKMINPSYAFNTGKYINNHYFTTPLEYLKLGEDAKIIPAKNNKPTLMIMVIGETARSQNIHHNGYERNTNPYTENIGLISFQHATSCGTATAISLPCMFSNMERTKYNKNRAVNQDNVLDILDHAGVNIHWVGNDGGDKRVAQNLTKIIPDREKYSDLCDSYTCYDSILLKYLPELINQEPKQNKLIALHLIGSHGPTYSKRYPKDKTLFEPACERSDIEKCSTEEIVNVYDNTIAYTDYLLAEMINTLKKYEDKYNVALVYMSDHGESLGENGLYLHGTPYIVAPKEQTHVPLYMWAPDDYYTTKGIDKSCIQQSALNDDVSHDNLFHTLLGFYGVATQEKQSDLDITAHCKL
ncbi:phosphoethanolamine--lipid A transferase [Psychromonas sp. RZ22]|uniref:phosphoethanolamine transferase n=1 Tax=Psychromonas algarum TaxID=2555643 RepID=UPI00106812BD|nr:phosphoethanolamine--lipid A transferase [Psychromonas sp. RZ22]TEW54690.1 phosphoethanolamine--lipid A transferase [Psychromonas sp. RZ22]